MWWCSLRQNDRLALASLDWNHPPTQPFLVQLPNSSPSPWTGQQGHVYMVRFFLHASCWSHVSDSFLCLRRRLRDFFSFPSFRLKLCVCVTIQAEKVGDSFPSHLSAFSIWCQMSLYKQTCTQKFGYLSVYSKKGGRIVSGELRTIEKRVNIMRLKEDSTVSRP